MNWHGKRYYSFDSFLKNYFGEKIYKVSLDGGFTCPNRDGTLGTGGCIFCSEGGSGDFASSAALSVTDQITAGIEMVSRKIENGKYIAYFQAFTNTYGPIEKLEGLYMEAINDPRIVALAIGTRPDCLPAEVLELLNQLNKIKLKYPVVMCSEHCNLPDVSFVSIDDVYSSQIAVNYLLSIGRTRIALINSQLTNAYARYREKGFLDALGKAGMQANNNWILHITEFDFDIAVSVITSLLKQAERPDALYCVSDVYGAAAIKAIQNFGLRVPEDIAVVGFDNNDLSKMVVPSLTTINQPKKQLGHQACEMLINLIENPSTPTQHILLDTELIVRSST